VTDAGAVGFGEALPRSYVTGQTRDQAVHLLLERILPRLLGRRFDSWSQVEAFLDACDGRAPAGWVPAQVPQTAAWCAVDLALLDAFGRQFGQRVCLADRGGALDSLRYSGVLSAGGGLRTIATCLLFRVAALRQVKIKVGHAADDRVLRIARSLLGPKTQIRVDANMAWTVDEALEAMGRMAALGVRCFEQPVSADDLDGMADLVRNTGLGVMADEGLTDGPSLRRLIENKACTAVNVRISKCGGLRASLRRCREALEAGLVLQVGCQVGESSLLSAAQLALLARVSPVAYAEGCYGRHLLEDDVAEPVLQLGYGGRPPRAPAGLGLGVTMDSRRLQRWTIRQDRVE
jgi:muconate cycloisomerase